MNNTIYIFLSLFILTTILNTKVAHGDFGSRECSQHRYQRNGFVWDERRGSPWDFDPGPADSESASWLKLYGQVPNYREVGRAILQSDDEKFRWTMGPMWYRGRLQKNAVKVFVVGQEGAQDENITNRAFTGSTGTRVQKFLNHLGIYKSYLFMNTFIYTIKDQRDTSNKAYMALEQSLDSPIVRYRHQLFDNVIAQNPETIALFVGVGGGGKESLATWINSKSPGKKKCHADRDLQKCDLTDFIKHFTEQGVLRGHEKIMAIGVPHPGGAAFGSGTEGLEASFSKAAQRVSDFIDTNSGWLPEDNEESDFSQCAGGHRKQRLNSSFRYGHAPVPFRDFSYGTNWRMGDTGTSSNRNGADKIQVFSEQGRYAIVRNPDVPLGEWQTSTGRTVFNDSEPIYDPYSPPRETKDQLRNEKSGLLYGMKDIEVPYEPPRYSEYGFSDNGDYDHAAQFDPGPFSAEIAQAMMSWPDFQEIDRSAFWSDPSFGFGPTYRGNTKNPEVVIIVDPMDHSDFFSTRALTGENGQYLQALLDESQLTKDESYLILRALPVDTIGIAKDQAISLALQTDRSGRSAIKTIKNVLSLLPSTKTVFAMGPISKAIVEKLAPNHQELKIKTMASLQTPERNFSHLKQWAQAFEKVGLKSPSISSMKTLNIIPRKDLPYSTRWWMGTTGDRAERAYGESLYEKEINNRDFDYRGHYYQVVAPEWSRKLWTDPRRLNSSELDEVTKVLDSLN